MMSYLLIAIGSALGGVARHWCGVVIAARTSDALPWGTLWVNVIGSFLIGAIALFLESLDRSQAQAIRELVIIGFLGGYTTFSAFSLQTLTLLREGRLGHALANVLLSVFLCLLAVAAGYVIAKSLRPA